MSHIGEEIYYRGYRIIRRKEGWKIYLGKTVINPANHYAISSDAKTAIDQKLAAGAYG